MKPFLFSFLCLLMIEDVSAQIQEKTDSVCTLVKQYFNARQADSLYALTGEIFRNQLPYETFKQITDNNLFPLGKMETEFVAINNGVSQYKAIFGNAMLDFYLSLDDKEKIYTFLFKPHAQAQAKKAVAAATNNPLATPLDKIVDSVAQNYLSNSVTTGLSIGVLKDGRMLFYGYGETAKGNQEIPGAHTLFEIGSISKTFTAILLALAVNEGKIKLDDPINKYLPDSIPTLSYDGTMITVKMLSAHTSGLPRMPSNFSEASTDSLNPYKNYTEKELFSFLLSYKLSRKPGTMYEYSNLAAATLGVILERIYNKPYSELVPEKICAPLHIYSTMQFIKKKDSARVAKGYNESGAYNGPWDFKAFAAAGSLRSDAADMLLYAKANLGEAPPPLKTAIELTHAPVFKDSSVTTALGWHYIKPTPAGKSILFHNGGTGGYRSYLGIDIDKK
ncbi:serine hydrolase domain-containing protein [Parafilimonas sp.]|uniref:serine hydrolase domain-containing protein n=1 Tax=Parafilimonas sp. TaxID=1969739 RepID=UPI0039E3FA37